MMTQDNQILAILNNAEKLREVAKSAFSEVDTDGSGYIDVKELAVLMSKMASNIGITAPTEVEAKEGLKDLDLNNDNKINLDEFTVLIKHTLEVMASQY